MVYSPSTIRLGVYLITSYPLAMTISVNSSWIKKVLKVKLVYSISTVKFSV